MIITDTLLERRQAEGNPIRVGVVGPGFMARGMMNHIHHTTPGMVVAAVHARSPEKAHAALDYAGYAADEVTDVENSADLDRAVAAGRVAVTTDHTVLTGADAVDVVVDATGSVDFGAELALSAIENGKHLVLMNAEVDATIGTILSKHADAAGVVYTGMDGDQPGVQMNLVRFVRGLGLRPLVAGNSKGLQDEGRDHEGHVDELAQMYDLDELLALGGAVDYVVKAKPGPGVYVLATQDDPKQQHYLNLYKLGEGPLYPFYTPYHLCHFEVPTTIARAVLLGDACIKPLPDGPRVEVVPMAKRPLSAGQALDAKGGYDYYGVCEKAEVQRREKLLPLGLAEGCVLKRDIAQDEVIGYDDVEVPAGRLADRLRAEQDALFPLGGAR